MNKLIIYIILLKALYLSGALTADTIDVCVGICRLKRRGAASVGYHCGEGIILVGQFTHLAAVSADQMQMAPSRRFVDALAVAELMATQDAAFHKYVNSVEHSGTTHVVACRFKRLVQLIGIEMMILLPCGLQNGKPLRGLAHLFQLQKSIEALDCGYVGFLLFHCLWIRLRSTSGVTFLRCKDKLFSENKQKSVSLILSHDAGKLITAIHQSQSENKACCRIDYKWQKTPSSK